MLFLFGSKHISQLLDQFKFFQLFFFSYCQFELNPLALPLDNHFYASINNFLCKVFTHYDFNQTLYKVSIIQFNFSYSDVEQKSDLNQIMFIISNSRV